MAEYWAAGAYIEVDGTKVTEVERVEVIGAYFDDGKMYAVVAGSREGIPVENLFTDYSEAKRASESVEAW